MKRTELGVGGKSLERGSTFKVPRASMRRKKSNPQKRAFYKRAPKETQEAIDARWAWACDARSGPCRICGGHDRLSGHHVVAKQELRRRGLEDLKWDRRNLLALCITCHMNHESAARRIPLALLRPQNIEFAQEVLGAAAGDYLERFYLPSGAVG